MREALFIQKIAILSLVVLAIGCGIYEEKDQKDGPNSLSQDAEVGTLLSDPQNKISFSDIHRLILRNHCVKCHNPSNTKGDISLATYDEVRSAISEIQFSVLVKQEMPPRRPLSANLQSLLKRWIEQGAPEAGEVVNATPTASPSATPEPTPAAVIALLPTYTSLREAVFVPKCLKCHREGGRAEEYPMDTYGALIATVSPETGKPMIAAGNPDASTVVIEIEAGKMPTKRSGLPPVTPEELSVIRQWILKGAKE